MSGTSDLTTAAGARAWFVDFKASVAEEFRETGSVNARAILIVTRDERSGVALDKGSLIYHDLRLIIDDHGAYGGKDRVATLLRRTARRCEAVGFAFASEAWALPSAARAPDGESWENVPGRRELVVVNFQHVAIGDNTEAWSAPVTRLPRGRRRLGPWTLEGRGLEGRFAGVLPTSKERAKRETLVQAMLAESDRMTPEGRRIALELFAAGLIAEGASKDVVSTFVAQIAARLVETGRPLDRPWAPEPPTADGPRFEIVNLQEAVPIKPAGKA